MLKSLNINASKYPPTFKFDLHIDDSGGVGIEAELLHFKTIIIETSDNNWSPTMISEIESNQLLSEKTGI